MRFKIYTIFEHDNNKINALKRNRKHQRALIPPALIPFNKS